MNITRLPFEDVFADESGGNIKTPQSEYLAEGRFPVIDQGKSLIAGYVNDQARICGGGKPAIIFGDHTRCVKYMDEPFCMGADGVKVLRPKIEADLKYLYYYLKQLRLPNAGYDRHFKYLKRTEVVLLPLCEQRRIAAILDKASDLRVKRREALAQLHLLSQSIFWKMFGDPIANNLGWPHRTLGHAVAGKNGIKAGPFGSALKKEEYTSSGFRVYGQEQVIAGRFDIGNYYISQKKFERLQSCEVMSGDLLVSLVGSFGKVLIVPEGIEPGIINPRLLKITPDKNLLKPRFLAELLQHPSVQAHFQRIAHGGTMGILNVGLLKKLEVIVPPVRLQDNFIERLAVLDRLKVQEVASVEKSDHLFEALQGKAFGGEL